MADQIKAAALMADKEEEIRIEAEPQLAFIERATGIKLEGRHEFTVASGRVDSVYDRVIIEYKNPKSPGARIGPKADSAGSISYFSSSFASALHAKTATNVCFNFNRCSSQQKAILTMRLWLPR